MQHNSEEGAIYPSRLFIPQSFSQEDLPEDRKQDGSEIHPRHMGTGSLQLSTSIFPRLEHNDHTSLKVYYKFLVSLNIYDYFAVCVSPIQIVSVSSLLAVVYALATITVAKLRSTTSFFQDCDSDAVEGLEGVRDDACKER